MNEEEIDKILKELENHGILNVFEDTYLLAYIKTLQEKNKQLKDMINEVIQYLNNVPNIKTKIGDKEILIGQTLYQKDIIELVKILERYKGDSNE